ncbi:cytochrome P450 [Gloeophyllum trabeum ATCC 11539]|uniref:Cytochrome P450 n=1 Tax=Gloeophyllum trabeum (strain ATCC 11539 / FP-39264 / Madison 617) TaxID=670483 RepID=S7PY10_GLOTA|nr:cytochrome P450 [Gloeophyllum trabeum ATCC 11539]EPQ52237.1 cytochrome P450 [Gloeophyllum trabeum ATCC 11539]
MYPVGIPCVVNAFLSSSSSVQFAIAIVVAAVLLILALCSSPFATKPKDGEPAHLPDHSLFAIVPFFRNRFDFLSWGFRVTGESLFQFRLLQHQVIAVSGEAGRKAFFTAKSLDLNEGFKVLSGAIPMLRGVTSDLEMRRIAQIYKRVSIVQREDRLTQLLPEIIEDCRRIMGSWGSSGRFDPFERVYDLVFQTTVRSLTCVEIADDAAVVARLKHLYGRLDSGTTPATVLLPWFPSPAMVKKVWATKQIYDILMGAINARIQSGVPRNDTLQILLDYGDDKLIIVGFFIGLIVAGARATGASASWLVTFLGGDPEWRRRARSEIESLLSVYSPVTPLRTSYASQDQSPSPAPSIPQSPESSHRPPSPPSLSSRLADIPLSAWEGSTPVLDAVIRETLRLAQPHTAMRRNVGPDLVIDGKTVPSGAYVVYPFSDVHLDADIYPDPWRFDPGRPADAKRAHAWVGWGGGKTVCLGQRLAKLEMKIIAAMFLVGFDYAVVDKAGKPADPLPKPNWNDALMCRPEAGSCYVKYERAASSTSSSSSSSPSSPSSPL